MPVYKDKKRGTFYVSLRFKDPVTGESRQTVKRGFETKKKAKEWEAAQVLNTKKATSLTFWEMFQLFLDNNDTSLDTRQKKESWIRMYFSEYMDKPIEDIERSELVMWRSKLKETGLSLRTMNNGLQYVRSVYTFYSSVYGGQNTGSILKAYKITKGDVTEMEIWTIDEFNQFLEHVQLPVYKAFFSFLFWTGCRRGEGLALTKDCFTGNRVHIYRSMKHGSNGFTPLKTNSSERTITLDDELMETLAPFIETAEPFIFGSDHSLGITNVDKFFKRGIKESGVRAIRLHDLRHSHASILLNNGVNIVAVSKRLGHSTVAQTLETYTHLMQETDDKMMEHINLLHKKKS